MNDPPGPDPSAAAFPSVAPRPPAPPEQDLRALPPSPPRQPPSDWPFYLGLGLLAGFYFLMILALVVADACYTTPGHLLEALSSREIRFAIILSLLSCSLTALLSVWVAVPIGYLMSRYEFPGKSVVDAVLDIPVVLPPMVVGLSLLILFSCPAAKAWDDWLKAQVPALHFKVTFALPSVILAQFMVACAFAVRTMRVTFDQLTPRREQVALTLGCSRAQAFLRVVLPEAWRGVITAGTIAWARALGEFGPILVFAGASRLQTEVLSTTVFLEWSVGKLDAAVAVSLLMVLMSILVLVTVRVFGLRSAV